MRISTCGLLVLLTACASAPADRDQTATTASTERVAAATVAAAPAAQPVSTTVAVTAADPADAGAASLANEDKPTVAKAKPGYTLAKQNGEVVYCRRETPTGSRRPIQNCYTPAQLDAMEQATRETQDSMDRQRNSSGCGQFCRAGS